MKFISWIFAIITLSNAGLCSDLDARLIRLEKRVEESRALLVPEKLTHIDEVKVNLKLMYDIDQAIRADILEKREHPKVRIFLKKTAQLYTDYLKTILALYGWITISKFGNEADRHAWLLVQHADHDPLFQAGCVFLLQQLMPLGETDPQNYAYLYDRVALNFQSLGLKQKYGTQVEEKDGKWQLMPFEGTLEQVNQRRQEVGLGSVEDYLINSKKLYTK